MKAAVDGKVVAESTDIVDYDGYAYFPANSVHVEWLEKTPKTDADLR